MCGIVGYSLAPETRVNARALLEALLVGIESRGPHATGVAWRDHKGQVWIHKDAWRAQEFAPELDRAVNEARTVIGHTRWATKGSPEVNDNNHPLQYEGVILTHNGIVDNEAALYDYVEAEPLAEVDSEAIAALLARAPSYFESEYTDVLPLIEGRASLAWIETVDARDQLHLARVQGSPLVIAQTRSGAFLYASTRTAIVNAAIIASMKVTWMQDVPEGVYLRIRNGRILDTLRFRVPGDNRDYGYDRRDGRLALWANEGRRR